ncbi:MAG TPA: TrkH family potassium uptake protein [Tessaracoccus flavescens]|uniref:TrkH family potassium uptake protein n=1 Tax=Tessaracoccus flavescens TaxID=399497 RepID=A0A921ERB5_9ACTN|nr:TrkH family potassium uptake protein [Tessaracoccus flavescens]
MLTALRKLTPVRAIFLAFTVAVWIGIGLLMLPSAKHDPGGATFMEAFFTATSAICVTGLAVVDTQLYWTPFGQAVIMGLIQVGGFGVMTLATVIGLAVVGKLSLRSQLTAATEAHAEVGGIREVLAGIVKITFLIEAIATALLTLRFWLGYDYSLPKALWYGAFHAVSSFNNAGFALFSDNLMPLVGDPWICLPIAFATILGGLGFPVLRQLKRHGFDLLRWSMNTRLVLVLTPLFLLAGWLYIGALEWTNPATLGPLPVGEKLLASFFHSVQTRTSGFNSLDVGAMHESTWLGMDVLMFIGTGPAGTGGGIKLTTFAVLFFIIWTEVRGDSAVHIFGKRLSRAVHRQAISVALLAVALVVGATGTIMLLSPFGLDRVLFEAISAFGTVGLSTGITAQLDTGSQLILCFLMYVGRLGPITFASALALARRKRLFELPKERPIIG